jgi:[acyl-carrier-protein] S-malonyltransferase
VIALVCPGQGSQTPGFLAPWLELPGLRERAEALSDAAGVDLVTHGTTSDADTIRDTAVAQPLIVGAGLLALDALYADSPTRSPPRQGWWPGTRSGRSRPPPRPGSSPRRTR